MCANACCDPPVQKGSSVRSRTWAIPAICSFWLAVGMSVQWAPAMPRRFEYSSVVGLVAAALFLVIATGLSRRLLRMFRFAFETVVEELVFSAALGLGILAYLVFALAALHVLKPVVLAALLATLTGCVGFEALTLYVRAASAAWTALREAFHRFSTGASALLIMAAILVALVGALAPATDSDTLRYHFAVPMQYIRHGGFVDIPTNLFANFPYNTEMLFAIGLALRLHFMAKLFVFVLWMLTGGAVWGMTQAVVSRRVAWLALASWCITPLGLILCGTGTVEHAVALFEALSLWGIINWHTRGQVRWLWLSTVFAGLALGSKYGAAISLFAVAGIVVVVTYSANRRRAGAILSALYGLRLAVIYAVVALVLLSPWLAKNFVFTHNPLFPFATGIFSSPDWPAECTQKYLNHVHELSPPIHAPQELLMLAYKLAFDPMSLASAAGIGAVFILFCPLALVFRPRRRPILLVIAYAMTIYVIWAMTGPIERFLLPALPAASVIVGYSLDHLRDLRYAALVSRVAAVFLLATNLVGAVILQAEHFSPYRVVIGAENVEYYLSRMVSYYPAAAYCNTKLPAEVKVLSVGETRTFYFERDIVADTGFNPTVIVSIAQRAHTPDEIARNLRGEGFTHILVNWSQALWLNQEFGYWKMPNAVHRRLSQFFRQHLKLRFEANDVEVFEILPDKGEDAT